MLDGRVRKQLANSPLTCTNQASPCGGGAHVESVSRQAWAKTSRNSIWPLSSVVTGPKLGLGMSQSANLTGI